MNRLMGQQRERLKISLVAAFSTRESLEQMVCYHLNDNLEALAGSGSLNDIVFRLIQTFETTGRITELLKAAQAANPGNVELRETIKLLEYDGVDQVHSYIESTPSTRPPGSPSFDVPFGDIGAILQAERFFDRDELLRDIFEGLNNGTNISLVGESQIGKTSILHRICAQASQRLTTVFDTCDYLSLQTLDNEDDFYEAFCERLQIQNCRGYQLTRALRGRKMLLCLDEIEKMAWDGFTVKLRDHLRGLAEAGSLRLVIASRLRLASLFPDKPEATSPLHNIFLHVDVKPFSSTVARMFLMHRLRDTRVSFNEQQIHYLLESSKGHPATLQRLAADLYRQIVSSSIVL